MNWLLLSLSLAGAAIYAGNTPITTRERRCCSNSAQSSSRATPAFLGLLPFWPTYKPKTPSVIGDLSKTSSIASSAKCCLWAETN